MALNQFITFVSNQLQLSTAIAISAGVSDANKIVATASDGKIDSSLLNPSSAEDPTALIIALG
jgi:hypothetical protein